MKVPVSFVFGLQTLWLIDFTKFFQLKGLEPKNERHMNFYECCDLTKKVYLKYVVTYVSNYFKIKNMENENQLLVPILSYYYFATNQSWKF